MIDIYLEFDHFVVSDPTYHDFLKAVVRRSWQERANELRRTFRANSYNQATQSIGGQTIRNEEIGFNEFGATEPTHDLWARIGD
jgi:hypothetical protein